MRYRILEKTGQLFQGDVFRAEWTGVEGFVKFVSVWKIRPELCRDGRAVDFLLEDLRLIAKKPGGAVTRVLDVWRDPENVAVCTEFEAGVTLAKILDRARRTGVFPPVEATLSMGLDVARALETMHEPHVSAAPVFHGDLRPEHIVLGHGGGIKIRGVGFGRFFTSADPDGKWFLWKGRCYQPLERQCGEMPAAATDVFSLGAILFELLAHKSLFPVDISDPREFVRLTSDPELFMKRLRGKGPDLDGVNDISEDLSFLLEKACDPDETLRFASVSDMAEVIHRCMWERRHPDSSPSLNMKLLQDDSVQGDPASDDEDVTIPGKIKVMKKGDKYEVEMGVEQTTGEDVSQTSSVRGVSKVESRRKKARKGEVVKRDDEEEGETAASEGGRGRAVGGTGAFVGRRELIRKAESLLKQVDRGGGALLVTGEMGMGRSRFLREARAELSDDENGAITWIKVRLRPEERDVTWAGLQRFLAAFMGLDGMAELWEVGREVQRLRAFSLDEKTIRAVRGASGVARLEGDPEVVEETLASAALHCWARLSQEQTTVVTCDDIHFIDASSVSFVIRLMDELFNLRSLFLMTAAESPHFLQKAEWDWFLVSEIPPFSKRECEKFILSRVEEAETIQPKMLALLSGSSKGSPLVLREYIDLMLETGAAGVRQGKLSLYGVGENAESLPSLVALMQDYLRQLPKKVSKVVLMSALAGPALDPVVLSTLGRENQNEIVDILEDLSVQRRLMEKKGSRYVFRNENMRELVVKAARKSLVRELAVKLSRIIFDEWDDPPRGSVDHISRLLEDMGERTRAAGVLLDSAGRRVNRGDYRGAAQKYQKAAELTNFFEDRDDSARLRLLVEAGRACLSDLDFEFAEKVLEKARVLARKIGKDKHWAEASILAARVLARSGRVNEAIDLARSVAPLAEKSGDDMLMAKVYASIAESYQQWGTYGPDGQFVALAVQIAETEGDLVKLGEYLQLAVMHAMGVGDYEKTLDYLERARPIAEAARDPELKARLSRFEGLLCLMTGDFDKGVELNSDGARFARQHGILDQEIVMLHNLGVCYFEKEDIREALYHFNESLRKAAGAGFHKMTAANEIFIGHIEATHLGLESGLEKIRRAIRAEYRVGRLWNIPQGLQLRGRTEAAMDKTQDALKSFKKAVNVAKETGVQFFIKNAERSLREFESNHP